MGGPREAGEPPGCMSWSHLIDHWRSAARRSKVRSATREDPRATGVAAQPVGFRTHDDEPDFAGWVKPFVDARCLPRSQEGHMCPGCLRKFVRSQPARMTWWLGSLSCPIISFLPRQKAIYRRTDWTGPCPVCGEKAGEAGRDAWKGDWGLRRRSDKLLVRLWSVVMLQLAGQMLRAPKTRPLPDS